MYIGHKVRTAINLKEEFGVTGVPAGSQSIYAEVRQPGLVRRSATKTIETRNGETTSVELKLAPTPAISGRVTVAGGTPGGVVLEFAPVETASAFPPPVTVLVDETGHFRVTGLPTRTYRLKTPRGHIVVRRHRRTRVGDCRGGSKSPGAAPRRDDPRHCPTRALRLDHSEPPEDSWSDRVAGRADIANRGGPAQYRPAAQASLLSRGRGAEGVVGGVVEHVVALRNDRAIRENLDAFKFGMRDGGIGKDDGGGAALIRWMAAGHDG